MRAVRVLHKDSSAKLENPVPMQRMRVALIDAIVTFNALAAVNNLNDVLPITAEDLAPIQHLRAAG